MSSSIIHGMVLLWRDAFLMAMVCYAGKLSKYWALPTSGRCQGAI